MNEVLRHQEESNREIAVAFLIAILVHLFLFLTIAYFVVNPLRPPKELPSEEQQEPLQLTILPPVPTTPPRPTYVSTTPPQNPDIQPKKDSPFESDNNSVAASESTPTGTIPLPSQDGRDQSTIELQDRQNRLGKAEQPAAQPSTPKNQKPQAQAEPTPRTDAMLAPLEKPRPKTPDTTASQSPAASKPAADSGYQPETRITRIRGNINNRGRAALEANATPLGRYKKQVSDAIGSRWYYYVNSQMGLLNIGTADIRFTVQPNGKVKGPQVLSNTSNESFASICISAILQAELPEIPPEVAKLLENGRLEIDYSFSILGN